MSNPYGLKKSLYTIVILKVYTYKCVFDTLQGGAFKNGFMSIKIHQQVHLLKFPPLE